MKILKIFGVVVGIHVAALILIFANPGCSSTNKASPAPSETVIRNEEPAATVSVPTSGASQVSPVVIASGDSPVSAAPPAFDPNAAGASSVRFSPTRPGTSAASALEAKPVADVTPATTYTVGRGDSLWTIAKKNHITVAELAVANNIKATAIVRLGQKLIIPGKVIVPGGASAAEPAAMKTPAAASAAMMPAPKAPGDSVKHVVKPGETLGAIARKYQVKVGEIAMANNISDPAKIRPGMELIIPGWQAPAAKSKARSKNPTTEPKQPADVPTLVLPGSGPDSDGDKAPANEPPVIRVEDGTPAKS